WHPDRHRGNAAMMRQGDEKMRAAWAAFEVIRAAGFPVPQTPAHAQPPQAYGQPPQADGQPPYPQQQQLPLPAPPPDPAPPHHWPHGGGAIVRGLIVLVLGIAITAGTYNAAVDAGGGQYFIAYGPVVFGLVWIVKGLASLGRKHP